MTTHIALFRGINVGGRNILPMKELVRQLESLGLTSVRTYIQSGNVVFESPRKLGSAANSLSERIAYAIESSHGFRPHVLIIPAARLADIIEHNPFPNATADLRSLHVFFLAGAPTSPDMKALQSLAAPTEQFKLIDDVFYLHAPEGIGRSKLARSVEKILAVPTTARNWRTVMKLHEIACS